MRRIARQEKMRKELEQARETQETAEMAAEDARSAIPVNCSVHFLSYPWGIGTVQRMRGSALTGRHVVVV